MYSWLFLIVTIILTAAANLLLKHAAAKNPPEVQGLLPKIMQFCTNIPLVTGISFLAIAVISYSISLRHINLSVAYPVMTTSVAVLVAFFSTLFFAESFTLIKMIGMVIVICGVILLSQ